VVTGGSVVVVGVVVVGVVVVGVVVVGVVVVGVVVSSANAASGISVKSIAAVITIASSFLYKVFSSFEGLTLFLSNWESKAKF
jgi:hypothetical protein